MVGGEADDKPAQRKHKRKRNRYELDDYFSLVELGEFIGRSRQHVVELLGKLRIIKWTEQGKKRQVPAYRPWLAVRTDVRSIRSRLP